MYNRLISLPENASFFLFGQRGTGKSFWLNKLFKDRALFINLLDSKQLRYLKGSPWKVRDIISSKKSYHEIIVIDEIQKIPELLDEVHLLMEEQKLNFALTGSSARKLRKSGVNLLAGRAFNYKLYPLTAYELGDDFDLNKVLQFGSLPIASTLSNELDRFEYLYSYVENYLKEEIILEQTVRQIEPFNKFLEVASQTNGKLVNYENIARDVKISAVSIKSYFQILEDTLIGFMLPAYHHSLRKRQKQAPKFYFYDIGLLRALQQRLEQPSQPGTYEYGYLFESFIINEITRLNEYKRTRFNFSHLRVDDNNEVDLIIERPNKCPILIEIKSKDNVSEKDVSSLNKISSSFKESKAMCFSNDSIRKKLDTVLCLHWKEGLDEIYT